MKRHNIIYLGATLIALATLASSEVTKTKSQSEQQNVQKLADANNFFGLNMYQQLVKKAQDNIFFSPLSVSTALGMVYIGARGKSQKELQNTLGYNHSGLSNEDVPVTFEHFLDTLSKDGSKGYVLNSANAVYIDKDLKVEQKFKNQAQKSFKAKVENVDFNNDNKKITADINNFVSEVTHGKIQNFISDVGKNAIMFLLNAVYFHGDWMTSFNANKTKKETFYNHGLSSEETKVPMMHLRSNFPYTTFEDAQVLELPYVNKSVSMVIILPNKKDGLADIESKLDAEKLSQIMNRLSSVKVDVSLPKFKVEYSKELSSGVSALGAKSIFGNDADFRGITSGNGIKVSQIQHKAVVEVNEKGSEAAAATGVQFVMKSAPRPPPLVRYFVAEHPFLFSIVDKNSGMILFFGRIASL